MPRNFDDYEDDFYAWTVEQARLLRSGELSSIDAANMAEEIEGLGRSDRRELESRADGAPNAPPEIANTIEDEIAQLVRNDPRATPKGRETLERTACVPL